jgi:hypothetical protein
MSTAGEDQAANTLVTYQALLALSDQAEVAPKAAEPQRPGVKPTEWLGVKPTVWIYRDHHGLGYLIAVGQNPRGYSAWALTKWGARYSANRYRTGKRSALNAKRAHQQQPSVDLRQSWLSFASIREHTPTSSDVALVDQDAALAPVLPA